MGRKVDIMSISNVAVPDNGFFRIVNSETKASGRVLDFMRKAGLTALTFTSPKKGGLLSDEQWAAFRADVAKHACQQNGKALLTAEERKLFMMDAAAWSAFKKRTPDASVQHKQDVRTLAGQKVGRWIGEQKAKAAKLEETPAGGNAHTVRPLQERVHVAANKALGQIQRDAEKVDPDTSLSAAKRKQVIELLEKVSKLTK